MQGGLDPQDKAKLDAEWARMQGLGRRITRQKAIATVGVDQTRYPVLSIMKRRSILSTAVCRI